MKQVGKQMMMKEWNENKKKEKKRLDQADR